MAVLCWLGWNNLKRIISTNCCIHTVLPPDDGTRYARNMLRLTKYTKNKLCMKSVFLHAEQRNQHVPIIFVFRPHFLPHNFVACVNKAETFYGITCNKDETVRPLHVIDTPE